MSHHGDKDGWALVADTFHSLGAAYLEDGDWRRCRVVWRFGLQVCPTFANAQLLEEVNKINCYPCAEVSIHIPLRMRDTKAFPKYLPQIVSKETTRRLNCLEFEAPRLSVDFNVLHENGGTQLRVGDLVPFAVISNEKSMEQRVFLTSARQPLLSAAECQFVINATESFAEKSGGWSTSRHYAVPTTDIPVHVVKSTHALDSSESSNTEHSLLEWFREIFLQRLAPLLAVQFQDMFDIKDPVTVAIHDAFVVKYDTGLSIGNNTNALTNQIELNDGGVATTPLQTFLPLHCDQSSHSFTIALNSCAEYEGGGTYFPSLGTVMRPDIGQVLSFPGGSMLHGGQPIVRGTRYILAVFAYIAGSPSSSVPNNQLTATFESANSATCSTNVNEMCEDSAPVNKRPRVQVSGFKDVCWKSQSNSTATGDEGEPASSHQFTFNF